MQTKGCVGNEVTVGNSGGVVLFYFLEQTH